MGLLAVWVCASGLPLAACEPSEGEEGPAPVMAGVGGAGTERREWLGEFLDLHWRLPVPHQGPPPEGWPAVEAELDPATCGGCHPVQYAQWRSSLHAGAFSPGLAGQLIEGGLSGPEAIRQCQSCHAPLAEQQPFDADGTPEPAFDPALRSAGIACAACHVRAHRRYGPPRLAQAPEPQQPLPHGGFEARSEFQQGRFCATCHQFFDDAGVNGKPIENTFAEWRESPHAAQGRSCQDCHMPERAHLWRGIHDADFVRAAVDVELVRDETSGDGLQAELRVVARDVGHRFPSYVTPRVLLAVFQVDARGREIPETRRERTIARRIDFSASPWREIEDTRIAPGGAARLPYALERAQGATALVGRVTVDPDHHYRGVFEAYLPELRDAKARELIATALRETRRSSYVLAELRRPLP